MHSEEKPDSLDRNDETIDIDVAGADPVALSLDGDTIVEIDEDLIDVELGEFDGPIVDPELDELDEQLLDADEEEDEDDVELSLLQEFGIDLDAADVDALDFDLGLGIDEDAVDDEVAA